MPDHDNEYKEVYFHIYCKTCKHREKDDNEVPCFECLDESINLYSHKPVKWEEGKKTNEKV